MYAENCTLLPPPRDLLSVHLHTWLPPLRHHVSLSVFHYYPSAVFPSIWKLFRAVEDGKIGRYEMSEGSCSFFERIFLRSNVSLSRFEIGQFFPSVEARLCSILLHIGVWWMDDDDFVVEKKFTVFDFKDYLFLSLQRMQHLYNNNNRRRRKQLES